MDHRGLLDPVLAVFDWNAPIIIGAMARDQFVMPTSPSFLFHSLSFFVPLFFLALGLLVPQLLLPFVPVLLRQAVSLFLLPFGLLVPLVLSPLFFSVSFVVLTVLLILNHLPLMLPLLVLAMLLLFFAMLLVFESMDFSL